MTLNANQLFTEQSYPAKLRCFSKSTRPKKFASNGSAPLLALLTPVAFDTATAMWVPWVEDVATEVQTIGLGAASAGTITISFDGEMTAAINYNANAATVQAALEALSNVQPGDITVTGGPFPGVLTLTFGGQYANKAVPEITAVGSGLTGGTITIATTTAGVTNEKEQIRGFVWPDTIQLHATQEVMGQVCLEGQIHYADIPLYSTNTANQLKAALRSGMRQLGYTIDGLDQVR